MIAGVVLLAGFALYAVRRRDQALVDVRLFARRPVLAGSALLFLSGAALYGAMLLLPLYFQEVRGQDVLLAGLLLAPQGLGTLLSRSLAGRLTDNIGARPVAVAGILIVALATIPFAFVGADTNEWFLMGALVVRGFGLGAVFIPFMTVAFVGLDRSDVSHASILVRVSQQVGGSFGVAVLAVILDGIAATAAHTPAGLASAFDQAFRWSIGFTGLAVLVCFGLPGRVRGVVGVAGKPAVQ